MVGVSFSRLVQWHAELVKAVRWNPTCMDASHGTCLSSPIVQILKASSLQVILSVHRHTSYPSGCVDRSIGSITVGSQWLVWDFETDATLGAAIEGRLGRFPECLSEIFLSNSTRLDDDERDYKV